MLTILTQTDSRAEAIMHMLTGPLAAERRIGAMPPRFPLIGADWIPAPKLAELASTCRAFKRPDGFNSRSVRQLVHRTLNRLEEAGEVETKMAMGMRGPVRMVRKRRLKVIAGGRQ